MINRYQMLVERSDTIQMLENFQASVWYSGVTFKVKQPIQ